MVRYGCPKCRVLLESPDSMAGQTDQCPICGHQFVLPAMPPDTGASRRQNVGVLLIGACALMAVAGLIAYVAWLRYDVRRPRQAEPELAQVPSPDGKGEDDHEPQRQPSPEPGLPQPVAKEPRKPAGETAKLGTEKPAKPAGGIGKLDTEKPAKPAGGTGKLDTEKPAKPAGGTADAATTQPAPRKPRTDTASVIPRDGLWKGSGTGEIKEITFAVRRGAVGDLRVTVRTVADGGLTVRTSTMTLGGSFQVRNGVLNIVSGIIIVNMRFASTSQAEGETTVLHPLGGRAHRGRWTASASGG